MRKMILGVTTIGSILLGAASLAGLNELTPVGPEGGRIFEVAFHPGSPNVVYAVAAAGLYRSSDSGASWQLTRLMIFGPVGKADIAVDPTDSNLVYLASDDNGVLVSRDGGVTFVEAALQGGRKMHVLTGSDGTVYVPDETGMFRSNDRGRTWVRAGSFPQSGADNNSNFAVDPSDSRVLYASLFNQGLFVTRDAGASWQPLTGQLQYNQTLSLQIDPANPQRIWAASYDGVYRSDNGGGAWAQAHSGWSSRIVIDPHDPMTVYASPSSSEPVWRTRDGGTTWEPVAQSFGDVGVYVGIAVHPTEAGRLVGYGNGIWLSADSGAHWSRGNAGLVASTIQDITPTSAASGFYVSTVNGIYLLDSNNTFQALNNDALAAANVPFRRASVVRVLVSSNGGADTLLAGLDSGRMARSVDGGSHWSLLPLPAGALSMHTPQLSPGAPPTLYVTTPIGVFGSTDFGDTWASRNVGLPPVVNNVVTTSDPQVLYAQGRPAHNQPTSLYRTSDGAQTWSVTAFPSSSSVPVIDGLAAHPTDPSRVIVTTTEGLFRTTDGGATWLQASATTDNSRYFSLAFDARNPSVIYAGGTRLLRSSDGGASWERLLTPQNYYAQVMSMAIDPTQEDTVLVGSVGIGLQQISFRPDLQITVNAPTTATVNTRIDFKLEVGNRSALLARDARVSLQLPANARDISATISNGSCSVSGSEARCTIASLPGESTASITLTSTASTAGAYALQASVAVEADANTANNSASGQVNVTAAPPSSGGGGGATGPLFLLTLIALICLHEARGRAA